MSENTDGIKTLILNSIDLYRNFVVMDPYFLNLLQKFKNIQSLTLNDEYFLNPFPNDDEIKALFPNLTSFSSMGSCLAHKIIQILVIYLICHWLTRHRQ